MLIVVLASAMLLCAAGCNPKAAWSDTGGDQVGVKSVVTCFVYDPTHDILYAGTEGEGLWRCTKASTSPHWSYAGNRLFDTVVSLAYDPARSILYVSGGVKDTVSSDYKGGVWRSKNPGTSPNWVDTHSPSAFVDMAYDRSQNTLYAAAAGVWRCSRPDSAASWSDAGGELKSVGIDSLIYDNASHTLFAGTTGVLWASTLDADLHWHNITTTLNSPEDFSGTSASALAYDSKRDVLYVGTPGTGVRRCANPRGARVWTSIERILISRNGPNAVSSLGLDPVRDILYMGGYEAGGLLGPHPPGGVWRCVKPDTAATWSSTGGPLDGSLIGPIAYDIGRGVLFTTGDIRGVEDGQGVWRYEPPAPGKPGR
jgi:hypothetical protein